jgi:hypothetical protein
MTNAVGKINKLDVGLHRVAVISDTDPGQIAPGRCWLDTSGSAPVLKVRNLTDDGWLLAGGAGGSATVTNITHADSPYTIPSHVDILTLLCDTAGGDIVLVAPAASDNGDQIIVGNVIGGGSVDAGAIGSSQLLVDGVSYSATYSSVAADWQPVALSIDTNVALVHLANPGANMLIGDTDGGTTTGAVTVGSGLTLAGGVLTASGSDDDSAYQPLLPWGNAGDMLYLAESTGTDLALAATPSVSSSYPGYGPGPINDANDATGWMSNAGPGEWAALTFGSAQTVNRIRFLEWNAAYPGTTDATDLKLQYWNGSAWVDVRTWSGLNGTSDITDTFPPVTSTAFRLVDVAGNYYWGLATFSLYHATLTPIVIPKGTDGQVLTMVSGVPAWA